MVIALTGARSKIVREPPVADDPRQRQPDITQARKVLDWQPTIPLKEGLTRTIAYFRGVLAEEAAPAVGAAR
jgi:UDP-glucuronate decarboxylase